MKATRLKIRTACQHATLGILFLFGGMSAYSETTPKVKPLDPSLVRFLAPSIKHAFGVYAKPTHKELYFKRLGRVPSFTQLYDVKTMWKDPDPQVEAGRQSILKILSEWEKSNVNYVMSLHILKQAPLPENEIPEALRKKYPKDPMNLEAASEGMYDAEWAWLGKKLNEYSQAQLDRLVLRPGWEMNGAWYPYTTKPRNSTPEEAAKCQAWYKKYWQRIHQAVTREMGGKRVLWDFCPSGGQIHTANTPPEVGNAYPGDEYVDIIGIDRYAGTVDEGDAGKGSWSEAEKTAFTWLSNFAAEHGKMTAVDETNLTWVPQKDGTYEGSDDYPGWYEGLAKWMQQEVDAHRLHHVNLFEKDTIAKYHACVVTEKLIPGREKQEYNFPRTAAKIIELFGGKLD